MPKRKSKQSLTLIEVVQQQQKVIATLRRYSIQLENEIALRDLANQKNTDEQIRMINAGMRAKLVKDGNGNMVPAKVPHRAIDEIINDVNVASEISMRSFMHIKRPECLR